MPELELAAAAPSVISQAMPTNIVPKSKDDMEKYASIIREINNFANSDIGKQLINPLITKLYTKNTGPNGFSQASQGEYKPMPEDSQPKSPFFNGDKPGRRVGPAGSQQTQTVIQQVEVIKPIELDGSWQFERFIGGLMSLQQKLGEDKTLKEAIQWTLDNKAAIILMTPPLKVGDNK